MKISIINVLLFAGLNTAPVFAQTVFHKTVADTSQSVPAKAVGEMPSVPSPISTIITPSAPAIPIQENNVVRSYYVELPFNKTVSVIFPTTIRSVDLGSRDIIADKASEVENVLKVKATRNGFNETNFSVITTDGKFWSFVANYNEQPTVLALNLAANTLTGETISKSASNVSINGSDPKGGIIQFSGVNATQSEVVYNCTTILKKSRDIRHLGMEANRMEATLRGVYVKDNVIYCKMNIQNKSNINYDVDYIRFFVVDKTVAKRSSLQEVEVLPFYVYNDAIKTIKGHMAVERVFAFQKFTIPDEKRILVMAGEINGGRTLSFVINNEDIMNADKL